MAREKSYDSACEILAEYFLGTEAKRSDVEDLAQCVQEAVEDWLNSDLPSVEAVAYHTGKVQP